MARTRAVGKPGIYSAFSASGGRLIFERENASTGIEWGADGSGIDTVWYGETAGVKLEWIVSSDTLATNSTAKVSFGGDVAMASASFSSNIIVTKEAAITSASFSGAISCAASKNITFGANTNVVLSSASGTMIGTTSTQKIGFLGVAPIAAQQFSLSAADCASVLRLFGLMTTAS